MSSSISHSTTKTKERPPLSEESDEEDLYDSGDDADAPRISQWVDEDDLEMPTSSSPVAGPSKLSTLKEDLSTLPMGALRHAQRVMKQHESSSESEGSDSSSDTDEEGEHDETVQSHSAREGKQRERKEVGKRSSKHAPMETSSKKPVTRRRTVVDVKVPEVRDPRFLPMTGQLSVEKFQSNYDFLTKSHGTELKTLRENLKRARKLLSNSPRDLRPEREAEVARLELAMKRAESVVNRDRQQHAERTALSKVKKEEQEKRKHGKGQWHMKDSAKKEVLAKARYEALAAEGGQRAVKKAIEKKRKKISQKEKRSRPDGVGGFARSSDPDRPQKRRKVG
ncbi:rRNA biogenesis protein rrp36 [Marasmius crinis-equi]|uniref:rRNA biogenesis protein RRP36 n=1 Tax=Marasmius crinis-equi TaxID=585013 RepID=A0ABR3FLS2_9AGAR